jgi:hypothetical protein
MRIASSIEYVATDFVPMIKVFHNGGIVFSLSQDDGEPSSSFRTRFVGQLTSRNYALSPTDFDALGEAMGIGTQFNDVVDGELFKNFLRENPALMPQYAMLKTLLGINRKKKDWSPQKERDFIFRFVRDAVKKHAPAKLEEVESYIRIFSFMDFMTAK